LPVINNQFFTTFESKNRGMRKKKLKRGHGSQKQTPILEMAETKTSRNRKKGRPADSCKHFKMNVMTDQSAEQEHNRLKIRLY
jgi:hypothetical protein